MNYGLCSSNTDYVDLSTYYLSSLLQGLSQDCYQNVG